MRNQTQRILEVLENAAGWVAMPYLAKCASPNNSGVGIPVHSRIADCRKILKASGRTVVNRVEKIAGTSNSFYRIAAL